jgi:nicotinate-nucleotide adenylyltransferase
MGVNHATGKRLLVYGGSFDPVHLGHVELARHFARLFKVDECRIVPAGNAWQKTGFKANDAQRLKMLQLAFAADESHIEAPVCIDQQEIERARQHIASYSVDTLVNLRASLNDDDTIIFLIGADQLQNLATWKDWKKLLQMAHIVVAARPGYSVNLDQHNAELAQVWQKASGTIEDIMQCSFGKTWIETGLAWDISATRIRNELRQLGQAQQTNSLIPPKVLDYIQEQNLYN